ncbi:hypothetical protein FCR2A7T_21210 [Flavobacterium cauense R2A-7]|uniref:Uncharacterized protein n=1 Tax=Flavobacterium cauense R2A-7 TaxID=1341154 RepID=V6RW58_9FLAO|nr:hypothetical protein [Flavobacterium cauense]ESU18718.1 hypothetical protein FCR2A7T_21210 [Flavobacterium cauense R2A-7]KGO81806.1 hypothetical protein Q762_08160 [Flavobacterium cauense R2A-7]TWI13839.1 hypothetical protein IP98_00991 [Flavobacterium cauense R2A-7]
MNRLLLILLLFNLNSLIAQKGDSITQKLYQDYKFEKDSLFFFNGITSNEFSAIIIPKKIERQYSYHVFTEQNDGSYNKLLHWSVPIKIFLDKSIPETIREDFKQFVMFLPKIERLSVSIVGNKNDANYYIVPVSRPINPTEDDFFKGITSVTMADDSEKLYFGRLTFNPNQFNNPVILMTRLKQFFFSSLGNFNFSRSLNQNSLLALNYMDTRTISKYDYMLLFYHYSLYNKNPIGYPEYKKLMQKINTTTFTNLNGRINIKL